jgi:hypothetical protein
MSQPLRVLGEASSHVDDGAIPLLKALGTTAPGCRLIGSPTQIGLLY